jgi:hypothetical protein
MRDERPGLIYLAADGTDYRVDAIADEWFKARQEYPDASFFHDVEGKDQALLRGLLALVTAWLDDPGDPRP